MAVIVEQGYPVARASEGPGRVGAGPRMCVGGAGTGPADGHTADPDDVRRCEARVLDGDAGRPGRLAAAGRDPLPRPRRAPSGPGAGRGELLRPRRLRDARVRRAWARSLGRAVRP